MPKSRKSGPSVERIPEGDNRPRLVCPDCGYIAYENPKIVVGAVCEHDGRLLLCRRAIEPRIGFWTVPAGFLEMGEHIAEGAAREVREEACAEIEITGLIGMYEIARIGQIHVFYRARLASPHFAAGHETTDAALFAWENIPWDEMAFPSVVWALNQSRRDEAPVLVEAPPRSWPGGESGNGPLL